MPSYLIQEWVTKRRLLTIEQAVQRLTSEPAAFFGFSNKGQVAPGFYADLIMFDPDAVKLNPQESTNDLRGGKARIVERSEVLPHDRRRTSCPRSRRISGRDARSSDLAD